MSKQILSILIVIMSIEITVGFRTAMMLRSVIKRKANVSRKMSSVPDMNLEGKTFHLKTYGCQMNINDSEIVRSILLSTKLKEEVDESNADIVLTNTCAIRENAEGKIWTRLGQLRSEDKRKKKHDKRIIGVLGCMGERVKEKLFTNGLADLVAGPDAYRDLPRLISVLSTSKTSINVQLSLDETYADVTPVRQSNDISAYVSVMRGCNNMCSFCVVPFVRGRERSREFHSVINECKQLYEEGVKEITLLGQNVNSYHDLDSLQEGDYIVSNEGFSNLYKKRGGNGYYFADLLAAVSDISPELRVRFTSPHPKDYPPQLLELMAERHNICNQLHMPAQSGSTTCLERMRRGYSREAYLQLIQDVHDLIPDVAISSDFITGFCDETEQEHLDTLSLLEQVKYDHAFMFAYSMRERTHAHRNMEDNVPQDVKSRRLSEIIETFKTNIQEKNELKELNQIRCVLVEGQSRKSSSWTGRTDQNKRVTFDQTPIFTQSASHFFQSTAFDSLPKTSFQKGDYIAVLVTDVRGHTLRGQPLWKTTLQDFNQHFYLNAPQLYEIASLFDSNLLRLLP